jgi:hypothetical protein
LLVSWLNALVFEVALRHILLARLRVATEPHQHYTSSGTMSMAPQGHSATQMPQPLQ